MDTRLVLCLAFMALVTVPAYGGIIPTVAAGATAKGLIEQKLDDHKVDNTMQANPSAPPTVTATGEAQALLSVPVVDVNIKKVPVVTVTPAPCKQVCADKCKLELQKTCKDLPVVTKECNPTKKAMVKKMCSKKCTLSFETPKVITSISEAEQPNPSKPPTAAETQLPSLDLSKSLHISDLANGKKDSKESKADLSITSKITMDASKADALVPATATSGRRLQGLIAEKAAETVATAKLLKSLPVPACDDVCEDVHFEVPDLECHEVTHTVQSCSLVPVKSCDKECVCVPQKTIAVNLPPKPTLSIKQDS